MNQDKIFTFKNLAIQDLNDILDLQNECIDNLTDTKIYYPLSRKELKESLIRDIVIGSYINDKLVAVAVIIVNRDSLRNLAAETGGLSDSTFTFDAVMVSPRWRGYGLQNILIRQCIEMAEKNNISQIVATVSPDNYHSLSNFTKLGFAIVLTTKKYNGLVRHIVRYSVAK